MASRNPETYRVGALAALGGLTPDALRYYERRGLLRPANRSPGGFRLYAPATLARVRFIKRAQGLGLTLNEIQELVSVNGGGGLRRCRRVRDLLKNKLDGLDVKLTELRAFREALAETLRQCEHALDTRNESACPVIEFDAPR